MELDYTAIGDRIRRQRRAMGRTQQELAELVELEPSYVSHIERGATKLGLPTIVNIANTLRVTVDDLLCDSLPRSRQPYERELAELVAGCSHRELKVITATVRTLAEAMRCQRDGSEEELTWK